MKQSVLKSSSQICVKIFSGELEVGSLVVYATGRNETYVFKYFGEWLKNGYQIDPQLPLEKDEFISKQIWGVFCDISPDRWGRLIQKRNAGSELTDSEYLFGVSDYFRVGAIRIFRDGGFIEKERNFPKLTNLNELCVSSHRIERGESVLNDLKMLLAPSGSLGGARPKASVIKDGELYIAKFPSVKDEEREVSKNEKTMLELAKIAGIEVCDSFLYETVKGTSLVVKRFDRKGSDRIPYMSAMTLLGKNDENSENASYCDLAMLLDSKNKKALFRRMVFNGLFGNTDDHLRNHGFLYDEKSKKWNLSPAFDITASDWAYEKQNHALNFIDFINLPSLELFDDIKEFFDINSDEFCEILSSMFVAKSKFEEIARKNGMNSDNLKILKNIYGHKDFIKIEKMIGKNKR